MATQYSTDTDLPALDELIDITDELNNINQALDCYHGLMTSYLQQNAEITLPPSTVSRFVTGSDMIFYSILSRLERVQKVTLEKV